jgi:hypothetical protein
MIALDNDGSMVTTDVTFERVSRGTGNGRSPRSLAIGAVVAALLVGGVVAVSRSQKDAATSSPSTTADVPPTSAALTTSSSEAASSTSPTTTLAKLSAMGNEPLLGEATGLELWFQSSLISSSGQVRVYRLDLDRATLELVAPQLYFDSPSSESVVTAEGFFVYGGRFVGIERDGTSMSLPSVGDGQIIGAGPDGIWVQRYGNSGPQETVQHVGFDGKALGELKPPADSIVARSLGDGRFLVAAPTGRSYLLNSRTGALTPLVGSVIEMARLTDAYVTTVCDDQAVCQIEYHDADGRVRPSTLAPTWYVASRPLLSPDGSWIVRQTFPQSGNGSFRDGVGLGEEAATAIENLASGESIDLGKVPVLFGSSGLAPMAAWSADGSWLFYAAPGGLAAWRPGLASPILLPVALGRNPVAALAVGPAPAT